MDGKILIRPLKNNYLRMKNKLIILLTAILGFTSCDSVLDTVPDGRESLADMFTNDATTSAYLNSCYKNFPKPGIFDYFWTNYRIALSDDAWEGYIAVLPVYQGAMTAQSNVQENSLNQSGFENYGGLWNNYWQSIRRCNVFLSYIGNATVNLETDRNRWTAEAKVLRACFNFELIKRYGPLPIITSPLGLNFDYSQLNRTSFKACVDNIVKDCNEAIATTDLPWRITTSNESGRMTKAVALAIKSQAILFAASPLWNDGNNYWAEAEAITKNSLDTCLANGYTLYSTVRNPSTFQSAYQEYFCSLADVSSNPIDMETILASKSTISNWYNVHGLPFLSPNKSGLNPTQELVDAYGMKSTGKPVLDLAKPYNDDKHLSPNYTPGSGYDPQNPYVGRDPRFYATVYYNGCSRKNLTGVATTVETFAGGNCGINPSQSKYTGTGYYGKKYDHPQSGTPTAISVSYKIYRLAELYLNYAEAANENGHTPEAIAAINIVRARATMPAIIATGLIKEDARLLIRNERRVELAYEENRYFDNRRYVSPDKDLSATDHYVTGMWILRSGTSPNYTYTYKRCVVGDVWDAATSTWKGTGMERACYTNKYLRWPIEYTESNRLYGATGVIWQNPGW